MTTTQSAQTRFVSRKVTVVTPGYPPDTGGVEAHTAALTRSLLDQGFDVEVLTARRGLRNVTVENRDGARIVTYPAWPVRALSISPQLVWAAIRRCGSGRLMHVHSYHASTALALLGPHTPTVFTPHYHGNRGHSPAANLLHRGFFHLAKIAFRRCGAVICVSDAERAQLVSDFPETAPKVSVIPNGVAAAAIRAAVPYEGQPPTVCCVGRLEPYKRVADIVRAFSTVPAPAQLVIIGNGTARPELDALVSELALNDRVTLTGTVTDVELHRWLRTARLYISLSQREAFGMAPLEAAAAGARIILSDIAAHREITAEYLGDGAVLVDDLSPTALASEIVDQLSLRHTPSATIPDWRDVAARTAEVYASVAATPTAATTRPISRQTHRRHR